MVVFTSEIGDEQPSQWISHPAEVARAIADVKFLFQKACFVEAHKLLDPLVDAGNPEAQFIASNFSKLDESPDEFERRRMELLERSASQDYPPALYSLGAQFDSESNDPSVRCKAAQLFRRAALLGHAHSQWIFGLNLLYGSNGIGKDVALGIEQISASAAKKFQGALETLARFHDRGEFGFAIDPEKAALFRRLALDDDAIGY